MHDETIDKKSTWPIIGTIAKLLGYNIQIQEDCGNFLIMIIESFNRATLQKFKTKVVQNITGPKRDFLEIVDQKDIQNRLDTLTTSLKQQANRFKADFISNQTENQIINQAIIFKIEISCEEAIQKSIQLTEQDEAFSKQKNEFDNCPSFLCFSIAEYMKLKENIDKSSVDFSVILDSFFRPRQEIEDDVVVATITQTVIEWPDVLIIRLERSDVGEIKNRTPINLEFSFHANQNTEYTLYGLAIHIGTTSRNGHYKAIINLGEMGWYLFNDLETQPINESKILEYRSDIQLLIYIRTEKFNYYV